MIQQQSLYEELKSERNNWYLDLDLNGILDMKIQMMIE